MPSTIWRGPARGGAEGEPTRFRGRRSDGRSPAGVIAGVISVGAGRGGGHQKAATAELPAELGGKAIGDPGAAQLVEQGHAAQADGETDEKLEDGFQHARPPFWHQPRRWFQRGCPFQDGAGGAMLERRPVCRWLPTIPCQP